MKRTIVMLIALSLVVSGAFANANKLYPLAPKVISDLVKVEPQGAPFNPWTDDLYTLDHTDGVAEYYLGSGAANDTFFVVYEPLAPCSVKYVEIQWNDAGSVVAFAADYSAAALAAFPLGQAPPRGSTPISPIGTMRTGWIPNQAASGGWVDLDIGSEFIVGNPVTLETALFGVGFIKGDAAPHPLADGVDARGIDYTYTWFGGPWMPNHGFTYNWGAYTAFTTTTVIDLMMRVWVSYPWGMPILISEVTPLPDTYNYTGPFLVTAKLVDDNGIGPNDTIELVYTVNGGNETHIDFVDIPPAGDDYYGANIILSGSYGDVIVYWVETVDDAGLENSTALTPYSFVLEAPVYPNTDLLFVNEGMDVYEMTAWDEFFATTTVYPEIWDVDAHKGIDESVVNWGWNNIFVVGWGAATMVALDDPNAYSDFLDGGGKLFYTDQDYFFANGLDPTGTFAPGDFAYNYFGLNDYFNDPTPADTTFYGLGGDPISGSFAANSYWTQYEASTDIWCDYFTTSGATGIFFGDSDDNIYGARYESGFKTVYLGFLAYRGCDLDTSGFWHSNTQFSTLINNVLAYFDVQNVEPFGGNSPVTFSLHQNYPNPFNPSTSISFNLSNTGIVSLKVFNLMGEEVTTLVNGRMNAGPHIINFDASNLPSGVYYYRIDAGDYSATRQMLLVK